MKELLCVVALLCLMDSVVPKEAAPKVQVYSRRQGEYGKANTLICHVSQFHPPEIKIELLKNGNLIPNTKQTDLAFEENWRYHLTQHVPFTPMQGEVYTCRVIHMGKTNVFELEQDV